MVLIKAVRQAQSKPIPSIDCLSEDVCNDIANFLEEQRWQIQERQKRVSEPILKIIVR